MAQTTVNYDELIQVYSSPISAAQYVRPKKKEKVRCKLLNYLCNLCNLSEDEISNQELRSIVIGGILIGLLSVPMLSITIIILSFWFC